MQYVRHLTRESTFVCRSSVHCKPIMQRAGRPGTFPFGAYRMPRWRAPPLFGGALRSVGSRCGVRVQVQRAGVRVGHPGRVLRRGVHLCPRRRGTCLELAVSHAHGGAPTLACGTRIRRCGESWSAHTSQFSTNRGLDRSAARSVLRGWRLESEAIRGGVMIKSAEHRPAEPAPGSAVVHLLPCRTRSEDRVHGVR